MMQENVHVCLDAKQRNVKKTFKAIVVALLVINVAVAGFVIKTVVTLSINVSGNYGQNELGSNLQKVVKQYLKQRKVTDPDYNGNTISKNQPSLEFLSLLKPVAHFSGLDFAKELKDDTRRNSSIRNWANSEGSERSLLYNDMIYHVGSVTVPAAGVYHINSHVKFYVEDNRKDDNSSQTFQHQIVRYSASSQKQVTLFEIGVTECREGINDGAHLEYPSCTGGLAQLDAGDQIIVRVSHLHLMKHDRDWHYFDIYLI